MKPSLLIIISCLMVGGVAHSQVKSKKIIQHDSTWEYVTCDTIFGKIQYNVGSGVVKGDGIILTCTDWEGHKKVPELPRDTIKINYWSSDGMAWGRPRSPVALIKTSKGYVRVSEKYIFIPD